MQGCMSVCKPEHTRGQAKAVISSACPRRVATTVDKRYMFNRYMIDQNTKSRFVTAPRRKPVISNKLTPNK